MMFMSGNKLTAEQRMQKAIIDIMANRKYVALAGILMIGNRSIENDEAKCPTAYTNGRDEVYGRKFVDSLNDPELRFLVLHEVYHKLYRHLTTWRWMFDENQQAANMACDYVINIKLVDDNKDGFATMTGPLTNGCLDEKYRDWDSARVFKDIKDKAQKNGGKGGKGGKSGGTGFDEHGWDDAKEMTSQEKQELAREIDEAIRQGALMAGKTGSGSDRSFEELLEPQVDWREVLREFVKTTCAGTDFSTWRRPNRRYIGANIYLPSGISEQVGDIVIAPDTSGSTFAPGVLPAFISEAKAICDMVKPERVHIIYWDTAVCQAEVYTRDELDNMVHTTKPKGGGGTSVSCVGEYMRDKNINPQAVVVLTDGYLGGDWGSWTCPVLWCVIDNKSAVPPNGKVVHIKTADF